MRWTTLLILTILGLFVVACFPGDSQEETVEQPAAGSAEQAPQPAAAASDTTSTREDSTASSQPAAQPTTAPAPVATPQSPVVVPPAPIFSQDAPSQGEYVGGTRPANSGNGMATDGGTLRLLFADPPTFDPHLAEDNISGLLVNEIFGGLVNIEPFNFSVALDLAERWEISPNGTEYTFTIHPNAKFHDGTPRYRPGR